MTVLARMEAIVKRFGDVVAIDGASLEVHEGEVHALLGENGAGKTTLMNVLYGLTRPDGGRIELAGEQVSPRSPRDAISLGIGMVHQHPLVVGPLTVAENLLLGGVGDGTPRGARAAIADVAQATPLDVDLSARMDSLPTSQRQRVEMLRCLARGVRLLILDEPTAVLTPAEVEQMFAQARRLADEGHAVIFITHKLSEVVDFADRVTVMRAGRQVGCWERGSLRPDELATAMVGQMPEPPPSPGLSMPAGEPRLRVKRCTVSDASGDAGLQDCSFEVCGGEILGIAGVEGNGQEPLAQMLFGLRSPATGELELDGMHLPEAVGWARAGVRIGRIPADRGHHGLVLDAPLWENLLTGPYAPPWTAPIRKREAVSRARTLLADFDVRPADPHAIARELSGGNQQKVVVARELSAAPNAVVAVNPTRGLDLGAQAEIQGRLAALRSEAAAVVLISTDLDEIMALSDRIGVLYRGALHGPFPRAATSREQVGRLMAGLSEQRSAPAPPGDVEVRL